MSVNTTFWESCRDDDDLVTQVIAAAIVEGTSYFDGMAAEGVYNLLGGIADGESALRGGPTEMPTPATMRLGRVPTEDDWARWRAAIRETDRARFDLLLELLDDEEGGLVRKLLAVYVAIQPEVAAKGMWCLTRMKLVRVLRGTVFEARLAYREADEADGEEGEADTPGLRPRLRRVCGQAIGQLFAEFVEGKRSKAKEAEEGGAS